MIDKNSIYYKQSELLLRILGIVNQISEFALKGGTAINFFIRNLPRLSVDIDLTFLPIEDRNTILTSISQRLDQISKKIEKMIPNITITEKKIESKHVIGLIINQEGLSIKIEPNLILRGSVYSCTILKTVQEVEELFDVSVEMKLLSFEDLYAGKICAALDRQHPRDLFDIKILFENEGLTDRILKAFVIYLAGHNRPMHELLQPNLIDFQPVYETEFKDVTRIQINYNDLFKVREKLVSIINSSLTDSEREFIYSIKEGIPKWNLINIEGIDKLPSIQWKLQNIYKMDDKKHKEQLSKLKEILNI